MPKQHIYTQKNLKAIKIISLAILILISLTTPFKFYKMFKELETISYSTLEIILSIFSFLLNFLLIVFSAILIKFPQKLFLIGIEALAYSLGMSIFDSEAIMSLLMLCVTFSTLLLRGNFNNNKKKILLTFIILYLFELLIPLRQGFEIFINVFFQKIGTTILLGIIGFFSFEYCKQIFSNESTNEKIMNIAKFKGLDRSDMYLLQQVLDNKKYKEIAQSIHGSEGALRNKLSKIYKILEVGDRTGFLTIYSGYELIYEPEQSETVTNQPQPQANRSC